MPLPPVAMVAEHALGDPPRGNGGKGGKRRKKRSRTKGGGASGGASSGGVRSPNQALGGLLEFFSRAANHTERVRLFECQVWRQNGTMTGGADGDEDDGEI